MVRYGLGNPALFEVSGEVFAPAPRVEDNVLLSHPMRSTQLVDSDGGFGNADTVRRLAMDDAELVDDADHRSVTPRPFAEVRRDDATIAGITARP